MQNCPSCQTELPDNAHFCPNCGHVLSTKDTGKLTPLPIPTNEATYTSQPPSRDREPLESDVTLTLPEHEKEQEQVRVPTKETEPEELQADPAQVSTHYTVPSQRRRFPPSKWLIISIIGIVVIAATASALVVLLGPHLTGTASIGLHPPATSTTYACPSPTTAPPSSICSAITPGAGNRNVRFPIDLTFSGEVTGHMKVTNWVTCGPNQAAAGGQQYHVAVFGTVGSQQYGLTFDVYPYTGPKTYTSSAFSFFGPAGDTSSLTQWRSNTSSGVNVTINNDSKSGTLDINLLSSTDTSSIHIAGSWTCS